MILAISTGWNWTGPKWTNSRAPWIVSPTWGTSGATSRTAGADQEQVAVTVEVAGVLDHEQGEDVEDRAQHRPGGLGLGRGGVQRTMITYPMPLSSTAIGRTTALALGTSQRLATWATRAIPRMTPRMGPRWAGICSWPPPRR